MDADALVRKLDEDAVIAIVTTKQAGDLLATPIWSVVVDGVPYLRSAMGERGWWYRHWRAGRPTYVADGDGHLAERDAHAAAAGTRTPVRLVAVAEEDPVQARIDAELHRKYASSPAEVAIMLQPPAMATTVRVEAV